MEIIRVRKKEENYCEIRISSIKDNRIINDLIKIVDLYSEEGAEIHIDVFDYFGCTDAIIDISINKSNHTLTLINGNGDKFITDLFDDEFVYHMQLAISYDKLLQDDQYMIVDDEVKQIMLEDGYREKNRLRDKLMNYDDNSKEYNRQFLQKKHKEKVISFCRR